MNTRMRWGVIGIIILILLLGGLWFYFGAVDTGVERVPEGEEETGYVPQIINAKHQYRDGMHTIAGEVDLPTPCHLLETGSVVEVREPEEDFATVNFTTTGGDEVCAQVITPARFIQSFSASDEAEIGAIWNGNPVQLNLVEAGPEEDLREDFELFIKG